MLSRDQLDIHIQDPEKVVLLPKIYSETFANTEKYMVLFQDQQMFDYIELREALKELTGLYSQLSVVAGLINSRKKNLQDESYDNYRKEFYVTAHKGVLESGEKFVSKAVEARSSSIVAPYRWTRDQFDKYANSCQQMILSSQSLIKTMEQHRNPNSVEGR